MSTTYTFRSYSDIGREQLAERFDSYLTRAKKTNVVIICGHYMLGYDNESRRLVALIPEEDNNLKERAKDEAGTFPMETFRIGVEMYRKMKTNDIDVKLLLLVNDTKVSSIFARLGIPETHAATLRRIFFASDQVIPRVYRELLAKNGLIAGDVFLKNVRMERDANSLLPRESYCWNEVSLQRRFSRNTSPWLVSREILKRNSDENGQKEVTYSSNLTFSDYCVVGKGQNGCLGISLELIRQLYDEQISRIVFMVPSGCIEPINHAAEIAQHFVDASMTIACIGGFDQGKKNAIIKIHKITYDDE